MNMAYGKIILNEHYLMRVKITLLIFCAALGPVVRSYCQDEKAGMQFTLSSAPYPLTDEGIQSYPYEGKVDEILHSAKLAGWKKSAVTKQEYLLLMEKIVRRSAAWVDSSGAVIDPYYKSEAGQTTPRFVSSAAILLKFGYIEDLKATVFRAMTYSCLRLAYRKAESPDFWMRELTTAFACLKPLAEEELWLRWESLLKQVDPESTYKEIKKSGVALEKLYNWTVYSSCGEFTRETQGLSSPSNHFLQGRAFFEKYMPAQLTHFTSEGMYRDPNDPITYDITTRLQIGHAIASGYDGVLKKPLDELLRRGGLTMLLFTSPDGFAPFGGRSAQFQFQEAIIAALCELEARRYKIIDTKLAGAFKRQAHISVLSMQRWIMEMQPLRHIKNGFPPQTMHGIDDYGKYSLYALYCSSVLGLAVLYADDTIEESPCPSEAGGYLMELFPAFHKIFASTSTSYIEIDTKADEHYDATGLGRFQVKDVPAELGLSMPFSNHPAYRMHDSLKPCEPYAIGPAWKIGPTKSSLAARTDLVHQTKILKLTSDTVNFSLDYADSAAGSLRVEQSYLLTGNELRVMSSVLSEKRTVDSIYFIVPLLVSDGFAYSNLSAKAGDVRVDYLTHHYIIQFDRKLKYEISQTVYANRNGIYRNLVIKKPGNTMQVNLKLE